MRPSKSYHHLNFSKGKFLSRYVYTKQFFGKIFFNKVQYTFVRWDSGVFAMYNFMIKYSAILSFLYIFIMEFNLNKYIIFPLEFPEIFQFFALTPLEIHIFTLNFGIPPAGIVIFMCNIIIKV